MSAAARFVLQPLKRISLTAVQVTTHILRICSFVTDKAPSHRVLKEEGDRTAYWRMTGDRPETVPLVSDLMGDTLQTECLRGVCQTPLGSLSLQRRGPG